MSKLVAFCTNLKFNYQHIVFEPFEQQQKSNNHLHLSLGEDSGLTLREVDRGGGHGHRRTGLDRDGLGGGLWLAKRLHLWVGSDHHGLLLVISERRRSPSASSGRRVILLAVFSIAAAVGFSTIWMEVGKKRRSVHVRTPVSNREIKYPAVRRLPCALDG